MQLRPHFQQRSWQIFPLLLSLIGLTSCALVYHSSHQIIPVSTNPTGIEVYVDGELAGTTPLELNLVRAHSHTLLLRQGEVTREIIITHAFETEMLVLDAAPGATLAGLTIYSQVTPPSSPKCPPTSWFCPSFDFRGEFLPYEIGFTLLLGVPPLVIDAATGAWYVLSPGEVFIDFDLSP